MSDRPPYLPVQRDRGRQSKPGVNPFISVLTVAPAPAAFPGARPQLTISTNILFVNPRHDKRTDSEWNLSAFLSPKTMKSCGISCILKRLRFGILSFWNVWTRHLEPFRSKGHKSKVKSPLDAGTAPVPRGRFASEEGSRRPLRLFYPAAEARRRCREIRPVPPQSPPSCRSGSGPP